MSRFSRCLRYLGKSACNPKPRAFSKQMPAVSYDKFVWAYIALAFLAHSSGSGANFKRVEVR